MNIKCNARFFLLALIVAGANVRAGAAGMPALPAMPGTGPLRPPTNPDVFRFLVAGDNRPSNALANLSVTVTNIFQQASNHAVNLVIWTGDTIYGKETNAAIVANEYRSFFALAKLGGAPVFNAPGNHEMDVEIKTATERFEVGSPVMQSLYRENFKLGRNAPLWGAFNYGNSRFIALNSEEIPPKGFLNERPPATPKKSASADEKDKKPKLNPGYLSKEQLKALQKDLDANADKSHIFIFMHHPVFAAAPTSQLDAQSAGALTNLFMRHPNVSFVLAGHQHLFYNPQDPSNVTNIPPRIDPSDRPYYLVSGGGGAPLAKNFPGSFNHYLIFDVNSNVVTATLYKDVAQQARPAAKAAKAAPSVSAETPRP